MKKILVLGASGLIGSDFVKNTSSEFELITPSHSELDLLDKGKLLSFLNTKDYEAVINFAAFTNVEKAEEEKGGTEGLSFALNAGLPATLAESCKQLNKYLVHISTEYIFDGNKETGPYKEEDQGGSINWYGQTKFYGEQFIRESGCKYLIIRTVMPYTTSFDKKKDIVRFFIDQLKTGQQISAISDQQVTPTFIPDITSALKLLINKDAVGIYHVASVDSTTPFEFVKLIAETFNLDQSLVSATSLDEYNSKKKAPLLKNSALDTTKFRVEFGEDVLHTNRQSLEFFKEKVDSL